MEEQNENRPQRVKMLSVLKESSVKLKIACELPVAGDDWLSTIQEVVRTINGQTGDT